MKKIAFTIVVVFCLSKSMKAQSNIVFGYNSASENINAISQDLNLSSVTNLPSSVDLSSHFPPVFNQQNYGTGVAISVAYYLRTYLYGVENNLSTLDLMNDYNQFSPKDLFLAIPASMKGANCNGTYFKAAFDVLKNRGVAKLSTAPYNNLSNCTAIPPANWDTEASNFKIQNYFRINLDKISLKKYLAQGRPIVVGIKVGDELINANNSNVLSSQTFNITGNNTFHSLVVCGYDDSKGANGAFRVINSWGISWGDNGYLWIDQNYFCSSDFCSIALIALPNQVNPDLNDDGLPDNIVSGMDLITWHLSEQQNENFPDNPLKRTIAFDVCNGGNSLISASNDWNIFYVYYNAYNANEYGILINDYYSNDYGAPGVSDFFNGAGAIGISGNWFNYFDIPSGANVAQTLYGTSSNARLMFGFSLPSFLNGYYYFMIIADGFNVLNEPNEINNYCYTSSEPIHLTNGVIQSVKGQDLQNNNCQFYPNPVNDILTVVNIQPNSTVSIYDVAGKMILNNNLTTNKIDVSQLNKGFYLLKIQDEKGVKSGKFIKQ